MMASNAPRCTLGGRCCYVNGELCPHLDGDLCSLRSELGSWEAVHNDPRYIEWPQAHWKKIGIDDCGDFVCDDCLPPGQSRE